MCQDCVHITHECHPHKIPLNGAHGLPQDLQDPRCILALKSGVTFIESNENPLMSFPIETTQQKGNTWVAIIVVQHDIC